MLIDTELLELDKKAKLGNPEALSEMAYHYEYGVGIEQNIMKSYRYYLKATSLNNSDAILQMCSIYYDKPNRVSRSLYWHKEAFNHPDIEDKIKGQCAINIAGIYEDKEEHDKVLYWVEEALKFGKELPKEDIDYVKFIAENTKNKILSFKEIKN